MAAKLHEVVAVEGALKKVYSKLLDESKKTFEKASLFSGQKRELHMFDADQQNANTVEYQELTTTVDENLDYVVPHIAAYWDAVGQKDLTNCDAKADIIVEGQTLASNVPATFLLGLEAKLGEIRSLYNEIPTLAPGIKWELDKDAGDGIFRTAQPEETVKTEKSVQPIVLYEATKEHPAQVSTLNTTKAVGKYTIIKWSGMLTPAEKADRLDRIDKVLNAVKQARQRANNVAVKDFHIGKIIMDFINM